MNSSKVSAAVNAILLDRDGTINSKPPEGEYITSVAGFRLLPEAAESIAALARLRFEIFVVTNQRGIARGCLSWRELTCIHSVLNRAVERADARIRHIYVCPHDDSDHCGCRKPRPGMLLNAIRDYGVDPDVSWMVGDSESDVLAGKAAGCKTMFLGPRNSNVQADAYADSLKSAAKEIQLWIARDGALQKV